MLNVGVIGCGGMGRDHVRRLTHVITSTKVVAVSDVFEEGGRKVADQYGVKFYKDGVDLIHDPEVDAVVVCTADEFLSLIHISRCSDRRLIDWPS